MLLSGRSVWWMRSAAVLRLISYKTPKCFFRRFVTRHMHRTMRFRSSLRPERRKPSICRNDGIGRRAGLKIRLPLSRADARNPFFYKGFQNLKNPIFGLCPPKCPPISGKRSVRPQKTTEYAGVMELADVLDSKSSPGDRVRVRPPPPAPSSGNPYFSRAPGFFCARKRLSASGVLR